MTTVAALLAVGVAGRIAALAGFGASASAIEAGVTACAVAIALLPAYGPRPMRPDARARATAVGVALALGTLGFAGYAGVGAVPGPATLLLTGAVLVLSLPPTYSLLRRTIGTRRAVVAGDNPAKLGAAVRTLDPPSIGYLSPSDARLVLPEPDLEDVEEVRADGGSAPRLADGDRRRSDGGVLSVPRAERIAGLSRLEHVLVSRDVDTVALGFTSSDREEFFGALRVCHDVGVDVKVHATHAESVLVDGDPGGELVDVELDPLPWYSRFAKRAFDVCFAASALLALAPVMAVIALAIALDSRGPILYGQRRTGHLGQTFELRKFRSMYADAEAESGARLSDEDAGGVDPRVTRVGRVLRRTHLDELPQLVSILSGDMSVVGPRPERPELDERIGARGLAWERRWFHRPGLTGLAQINHVTGFEPEQKLAYDLEYRSRQSFWVDVRIVLAQIRIVLGDVVELLRGRNG